MHLKDVLTQGGVVNQFHRNPRMAMFKTTLLEGGANYDLTEQKKWLRSARDKAGEGIVDVGSSVLSYNKETDATNALSKRLETLNGQVPDVIRESSKRISGTIAAGAGSVLNQQRVNTLVEDVSSILTESVKLAAETARHREYQTKLDAKAAMIMKLINKQG